MLITPANLTLLLGMSLFFGFTFEELYGTIASDRPGGIRTFPLLAMVGAGLYAVNTNGLAFTAGLLAIGIWQYGYDRGRAAAENATPIDGRFVVPACNLFAYTLGALALIQPPWVVVALTVAAALLLASRTRLHQLAQTVPQDEIFIAGQFLLLIGVLLPLLPGSPIAGFGALTPHRLGLAVVAVSSLSYGGYLLQRYVRPKGATLLSGLLGGLYSSTATTIALARNDRSLTDVRSLNVAIILSTAMMYARLFVIVSLFNQPLGFILAIPFAALLVLALILSALVHVLRPADGQATSELQPGNPLHLGAATIFALLLILVTLASNWTKAHYGHNGIDVLASLVGVTDIDPFVLSIAQGGLQSLPLSALAAAILFAASSNNAIKAIYALAFGGMRRMYFAGIALAILSAGGILAAFWLT